MKVYTRITVDMATGHVIDSESFEYAGVVAGCKGDSIAKQSEQQTMQFQAQLMQTFNQQFAYQKGIMDQLKAAVQPMIDHPQGYTPEAMAALRTGATDTTAQQYANAQQALNSHHRSRES